MSETAQIAAHVIVIADQLHLERVSLTDENSPELQADARLENPWPQLPDSKTGMYAAKGRSDRRPDFQGDRSREGFKRRVRAVRSGLPSDRPLVQEIDKLRSWTQNVHMKTATVRDLRNNFAMLEAWLSEGESVRIEKRGEPVALLSAMPRTRSKAAKRPDFAARQKAIWGARVFSDAEVIAMRAAELEGEEG